MELKHMLSFKFIAFMLMGLLFFAFVATAPETKPEVAVQQYMETGNLQTLKDWFVALL